MEKLEQERNTEGEVMENAQPEKGKSKRKFFRKNQIIITALAVMIAVAGYINYADSTMSGQSGDASANAAAGDADTILKDIESLDLDLTDETAADADAARTEGTDVVTETPGEAVLTGASTYMAEARIDREQVRSQNKEILNSIINNETLSETERQGAVQSMVEMTELVEKESATELLLEAKGFTDVIVNLTGETADVVVPRTEVSDEQRAQIEDIVARKTGVAVENIVITPMNSDNAAESPATAADDGTGEE